MSNKKIYKLAEAVIDDGDIAALKRWLGNSSGPISPYAIVTAGIAPTQSVRSPIPQLTKGALTLEFERQWARWIGTRYAIFCNSGSSANLLAAYAALQSGKLRNKKVIVPSVGWVTTISPFMQFGFDPIMCGADQNTFALDYGHLEKLLKDHRPSLVVMVQVLGVPGAMEELTRLQRRYGFLLMEDACAALGAEYGGKKVGSFGDMSTFSFFFGHQLSTIEGGMVNTNDKKLYDLLLMLRSHGWGKDLDTQTRRALTRKYQIGDFYESFTFFVPGFNLRSTDLQAFLGLRMMEKADKIAAIRRRNHELYAKNLANVDFQKWNNKAKPCSISFGALAKSPAHRKAIVKELVRNGIETRLFSAGNLGLHPFWFERYGRFHHPVSDRVHQCGFFLPNNESLSEKDIRFISEVVNSVKPV